MANKAPIFSASEMAAVFDACWWQLRQLGPLMMRCQKILWLILALALSSTPVRTQPVGGIAGMGTNWPAGNFLLEHWQTDEGLPHNVVSSLAQSPDGFLWLGTGLGVVSFDGIRFETFKKSLAPMLVKDRIRKLAFDTLGRLWIAPENGRLIRYQNNAFFNFESGSLPFLHPVVSLCPDANRGMWAVDSSGVVARINDNDVLTLASPFESASGAFNLASDSVGQIWFGNRQRLGVFRNNQWSEVFKAARSSLQFTLRHAGGMWVAADNQLWQAEVGRPARLVARLPWVAGEALIRQLFEDDQGAVWIATNRKGLFRFADGRFSVVPTSQGNILCIFQDRESNLWVGTQGGGLNRIRKREFQILDLSRGLPNEIVNSIAEDKDQRLWVATQDGGLGFWQSGAWKTLNADAGWPKVNAFCLAAAADGRVWIGTQSSGLFYWQNGTVHAFERNSELPANSITSLFIDRQEQLWIGYESDGLCRVTPERIIRLTKHDGLAGDSVHAIAENPAGSLWIGTSDGAVQNLTLAANGAPFSLKSKHQVGLAIRTLLPTSDGELWIGTVNGGLWRLKQNRLVRISTQHGLPDETMQQMLLDDAGRLWVGTSLGLFSASLNELNEAADGRRDKVQTISYGRSDGLGAFQFTGGFQPAACRSRDGTFCFSSVKGVVAFRSSAIMQYLEPPKILLQEILWDNHPLNPGTTPRLPPESRQLEFHFTTPVLGAPDRVRFRFKLEGLDNTWVENSRLRAVVYSGLRPGNYVFRVAACNPDGIWNEPGISFAFSIAPHFWQTNWFVACLASLVAGAVVFTLRYAAVRRLERRLLVVEKQHAVEKERARIAQDIHDELGANLTSIGWLADVGRKVQSQPEVVSENLNKISSTARQSLTAMDAIVWALSPRNDSFDHFANYVAHYAEDFFRPTNIRCRMDIPPNLADRPMSTEARHHLFLALKEALNNVVKHSQATEVLVRLHSNAEELCLSVEDNGQGLPSNAAGEGQDGLINIRNRVEGLGGELAIEVKSGKGLALNLRLPWALLKPR